MKGGFMDNKRWIVSNISANSIPFQELFDERNKYNLPKEKFFSPDIKDEFDPLLMLGMKKSIQRILKAIDENQRIYIYGDYDVDGTCAAAIILKSFNLIGYENVNYYIPSRQKEGYGLNIEAIDKIAKDNASLIITVDCGITAQNEVDYCNEQNIDVIITDHHQVYEKLPKAYSIINPHQKNCKYPYKNLCGAGIAYKLAKELLKTKLIYDTDEILELAGIATVADIMELNGENRLIVKNAINQIKKGKNLGIDMLISEAGLKREDINSYSIGFAIAPRINSAGRIDDASLAVKLYMSKNESQAKCYAQKLNKLNYKRQEMVKDIYEQSLLCVQNQEDSNVIVSFGQGWEAGVIGIVASKLVEKFDKPSIVIAINDEIGVASCRSIQNFNIFEAMQSMSSIFEKFGGHEMAGGFSLKESKIPSFIKKINAYAKKILKDEDYDIPIKIDSIISANDINLQNYDIIDSFEPFGVNNPKPVFVVTDINIENIQFLGKDKTHFKARTKNFEKDMLKFNSYEELKDIDLNKKVDIAFYMNKNVFGDNINIQMFIEDMRYSYDYEKDYQQIYKIVKDNVGYFEMNYDFTLEEIQNFTQIEPKDINSLQGKTAYLCYTYNSYFYLRKLMEYSYKKLYFYQDEQKNNKENTVILFPLLDKTELAQFDNIVICDDIDMVESIVYEFECKRYILNFSKFYSGFSHSNLRENMVVIYKLFKKYDNKPIKLSDILRVLKLDDMMFFICSVLLCKCNLVDISYDFQYNKIYAQVVKTNEKQNINDNLIYKKIDKYFSFIKENK